MIKGIQGGQIFTLILYHYAMLAVRKHNKNMKNIGISIGLFLSYIIMMTNNTLTKLPHIILFILILLVVYVIVVFTARTWQYIK